MDSWNPGCPGRALWPQVEKTAEVRKSQVHLEGPKAWGVQQVGTSVWPKNEPQEHNQNVSQKKRDKAKCHPQGRHWPELCSALAYEPTGHPVDTAQGSPVFPGTDELVYMEHKLSPESTGQSVSVMWAGVRKFSSVFPKCLHPLFLPGGYLWVHSCAH